MSKNKNTPISADESFFSALESELASFVAERASIGKTGAASMTKGSGTADDPFLAEGADRYSIVAEMAEIAKKLDKSVHFVHGGHGYVATLRGIMESEEFDELSDLDEAKVRPGETKEEHHGQWIIRYDLRPQTGSTVYRGIAWHPKSEKTPRIKLDGTSVDDIRKKLVATIDSTKSQKVIDPSQRVMIDFNVLVTRNIIGHKDTIYGDMELIDGVPTLLVSAESQPGFQKAADRTPVAQRTESSTGQHAFSLSGKKAIAAGLTHARYILGEPFDYMPPSDGRPGITGYPLKFGSEVHPNDIIRMNEPGVTVAYPRGVAEGANEDGVFEGIFKTKDDLDIQELTKEQRDLIRHFFNNSNVDIKRADGAYVLPQNAMAPHGKVIFRFYNNGGQLMAGIEHYRSSREAGDIKQSPVIHTDHVVKGPWDLEELMKKYSGNETDDLTEAKASSYTIEGTAAEFFGELKEGMRDIVDDYQQHVVAGHSQPAAPDSSKFRAAVGGMIEYAENVQIHGGRYGVPKTFRLFIKIGGAIKPTVKGEIKQEFAELVNVISGHTIRDMLYTEDGYRFIFDEADGTAWGGYGVRIDKATPPQAKVTESDEGKARIRGYKDRNGVKKYEVLNADGVRVKGDLSHQAAKDYLTANRSEMMESLDSPDEISKIDTAKLREIYDLHLFYSGRPDLSDPETHVRGKVSTNRFAAELAKRGIIVPTVDEGPDEVTSTINPYNPSKRKGNATTVGEGADSSKKWCVSYELPNGDKKCLEFTAATAGEALTAAKKKVSDGVNWNVKNYDVKKVSEGVDGQADLSKIDTAKLQEIHALHRHYGSRDDLHDPETVARLKASTNRVAAELAKRGIKVPTIDEGVEHKEYEISYSLGDTTNNDGVTSTLGEITRGGHVIGTITVRRYSHIYWSDMIIDAGGRKGKYSYDTTGPGSYARNIERIKKHLSGKEDPKPTGPLRLRDDKEPPVSEAKHGLSKHVKIVKGPEAGKTGWVGEVRHGAFKGAKKEYTIDLEGGGNVRCTADQLRLIKDEQVEEATDMSPKDLNDTIAIYQNELRCAYGNGESAQRIRQLKAKIAELEGHKNSPVEEGWKGAVAGIAAAGAITAGIGMSPKLTVDGETYDLALSSTTAPADAKVVKKNGETFKVWKQPQAVRKGPAPNTTNVYQKVEEGVSQAVMTEAATPEKKIASLEKQYNALKDRLGLAKEKRQTKKGSEGRLLSSAESKIMSKMSAITAQIYQVKDDAKKKVAEALIFPKGGIPDVDHMNGSVIRDWGDKPKKQVIDFRNLSAWKDTADKVNSEVYDDNAEIMFMSGLREYDIDGKVFARWDGNANRGWVQTTPMTEGK